MKFLANGQWPDSLMICRHGQSAGNVARDAAEAAGLPVIDIKLRDIDVPLSPLGVRQAQAVGEWFLEQDETVRPTIILTSPYIRAQQTAQEIANCLKRVGQPAELVFDERLREREFGALDRLTKRGIKERFPAEDLMRAHVGKFYYRPPGGESWCDVILRLRSVLDSLARDYAGERVLVVCHSVVILCLRYIFEAMTEEEILKIDRETDIANCSLTTYKFEAAEGTAGKPKLETFNFIAPLKEAHEPVTTAQDAPTANS